MSLLSDPGQIQAPSSVSGATPWLFKAETSRHGWPCNKRRRLNRWGSFVSIGDGSVVKRENDRQERYSGTAWCAELGVKKDDYRVDRKGKVTLRRNSKMTL
ncbi:hypothetical protein TREMEDRAFT_57174 [Tremella mesenterica DSM 1558]|nr:uncharacterized protein TREMEDRAFT_57174 [Tremella mesenterica DSM 1558]EIW68645.1 hypothetical protein TREMEDRAFT_57174 [Tremella mesenterica DSM 1558]